MPDGVSTIQVLTFLLSVCFGLSTFLFSGALAAGLAGDSRPHDFSLVGIYYTLFIITAFLAFVTVFLFGVKRKIVWFSLIAFWIFLLIVYISIIIVGNPFDPFHVIPRTSITLLDCLSLGFISYSLVCITYFQTRKVKTYYGFKESKKPPK